MLNDYNRLKAILENSTELFPNELLNAVNRGFNVNFRPDARRLTLLFIAVLNTASKTQASYNSVRALLEAGADVNIGDYWGHSVLSRCVTWNMPQDIIDSILEKTIDINALDRNGKTIFGTACQAYIVAFNASGEQNKKRLNIIKNLIEHGADPEKDMTWKILNQRGNEYASMNDRLALKELGKVIDESRRNIVSAEYIYAPSL